MQNGSLRRPLEGGLSKVVEDIGRTALHEAAVNGDEKTLHILLSGGSDRNSKDNKHGNTPLHEAAWRGYSRCVKALCALPQPKKETKLSKIKGVLQDTRGALHSALLSTRNAGGFTALHLAAQNGHNQSCREILLAGSDPDVQNNYGDTPLHTACRYGHAGATRILISAKCDPNRTNLNGDTPLHIACAMGRRKLTRILLEAGSSQEIPNGQNEMPRDIAIRKELTEILDILNTPVQIKPPKERDRSSSNSKSVAGDQVDAIKSTTPTGAKKKTKEDENIVNWSPYGCHYFPDPRSFPSPKLETLPKEPLKKGEQYYLDLAGNIRKGPIGVGNTCYCGPFFRHIEDRISKNRKSLRKYVNKATERLDNKVEALALRTDDQIEQLARSMMADRIRCEGRQLHLQEWLRRGEANRLTVGSSSKSKKNIENANTLTKCRSLELLDGDNLDDRKMQNSRSFDILDESEVIVHRSADAASPSLPSSGCRNSKTSDRSRISNPKTGNVNYSVSKRLEELLFKTNEILEMDRIMRRKRKDNILSASPKKSVDKLKPAARPHSIYDDNIMAQLQKMSVNDSRRKDRPDFIVEEMAKITSSLFTTATSKGSPSIPDKATSLSPEANKNYPSRKELERKGETEHERSSIRSGASSHPNPSSNSSPFPEFSPKDHAQIYQSPLAHNYENVVEAHNADTQQKFKTLITALRKDYNSVRSAIQEEIMLQETSDEAVNGNQSPYSIYGDSINSPAPEEELSVDSPQIHAMLNCFYQNSVFDEALSSSSNTLKSEKRQTILEANDNGELAELRDINEINELKNRILNGSHWRSEVLKQRQQELTCKSESPEFKGSAQKFDIRNGAIRTLNSPSSGAQQRNKVQELVAKLEQQNDDGNYSESSEDESDSIQQNPISNEVPYYCNQLQPQDVSKSPENRTREQSRLIDTRNLIPKDAYFHELPNKNRLQPVAIKKLPDKQMLQFSESFQMARTRNPLPYVNDYEIPITPPGQSNQYNPAAISSLPPPSEKLLANRKFPYSNPVDLVELSRINANNYQHLQQPLQLQMPQMIGITPEQAQIERDLNNDSGYSTKICGSSHGPSPSLSGHTDYSSGVGMSSNTIGHHELQMKNNDDVTINTKDCVPVDANAMSFYIGSYGTSSLV